MRMRFIGKLRSQAQITKIKNGIRTKLQQVREGNLKIKAMNSLKNYLKSTNCANYKKARMMRKSNLIKKSITCLKSRTELSKLGKAIAAKNRALTQKAFFSEWTQKKQMKESHRQITATMGASKALQIFNALKTNVKYQKDKKSKQQTAIQFRKEQLLGFAISQWHLYLEMREEKKQLTKHKERFADMVFMATIMQHWLETAKFKRSLRAIGYLIQNKHQKRVLGDYFQTMKI